MSNADLILIAGSDGVVPVYEPKACWKIWAKHEIFMGANTPGENRYVGKINDLVVDVLARTVEIITEIDPTSLVPKFKPFNVTDTGSNFADVDLLLSDSPGLPAETFRLYIDKSVVPYQAQVEARCFVRGTMASYARVYRGSDVMGNKKLISAFYDNSGNFLGGNVPLELAELDKINNITRRVVMPFFTTEDLPNEEVVTVVFYSDTGSVISMRQLIVVNTGFIATTDASQKFITHISLETPFLSETDSGLIEYPVNVPIRGFNLFGVVHYSDGSSHRMPVDDTKFEIFGLENYVATLPDQKMVVSLKYNLSPDEICYEANGVNGNKFIQRDYNFITKRADGAYSVKLFGYPVWVDIANGYRLEWWLLNLDRKSAELVTNKVQLGNSSKPFRPLSYGNLQNLNVVVDLNEVNGIYKRYIHTQSIEIILRRSGDDIGATRWTIGFEPGQDPQYGKDNRADTTFVNQNLMKLNISQGCKTLDEWLDRMFYLTKPLFDSDTELKAPEPNMFSIVISENEEYTFRIDEFKNDLTINRALANNSTVFVKFFKRTVENDLVLGVSGIPVYQLN